MAKATTRHDSLELAPEALRWTLDPASLPFRSTAELDALDEIVGQERGCQAFHFGIDMLHEGYNIFVTGAPGTGRMELVKKLLDEHAPQGGVPDDLCYVNNFKNAEEPILLAFPAGRGAAFKKAVRELVETLKREIPQLFESQEYLARKKEIVEAYERRTRDFFKNLDKRVKEMGFALVQIQAGEMQHPELMPMVDGEPVPMLRLEDMVDKGRFPREEFEELKKKHAGLKQEIDQIFLEVRDLQKELHEKGLEVDRDTFQNTASTLMERLLGEFDGEKTRAHLQHMLEDMAENLELFRSGGQVPSIPGMPPGMIVGDPFQPYAVNLIVDNADQQRPPVIMESYPTYRNLFGSIERVFDRSGVWRTDFSRIKVGSFIRASGGVLVLNLLDSILEPGVWPALKRALKTEKMEIQTFDPFYMFSSSALKPEPIPIHVKVVVVGDNRLYHLLRYYDEDVQKIFKIRADFDTSMDKTEQSVQQIARFVRKKVVDGKLPEFDAAGIAAVAEEAVRMTGRSEKISLRLPEIADLAREAAWHARQEKAEVVSAGHVQQAVESRIFRSNLIEEKIQELIERGTLLIDTEGGVVGQVNGLSVYQLGDHMFGRPTRITAATALGREGVINIEREAAMSGPTHDKGVLILSGFLRRTFAQDKPLSVSASLAFEQSYSGVDGDSASSTEIYAILSSLAGVPLRQDVAVTGSVNQKGEIQPIGGVNAKIEGFFDVCAARGLTGAQGVIIPRANVPDLMLRRDVVEAVREGKFHVWAVDSIAQGVEILTGLPAGERGKNGKFPKNSVLGLADARLVELAETLQKFGKKDDDKDKRHAASDKKKPEKPGDVPE